jgi:hypothetical protein
MRARASLAGLARILAYALALIVSSTGRAVQAAQTLTADVLIQAGHEGRPDCGVEPASLCNNSGAPGEIRWTPITADVATRTLRAAGISVLREPAHLAGTYSVREAVFVHFDGATESCASGPSVGYPVGMLAKYGPHSAAAAAQWKALWGRVNPFRFEPDNFTPTLREYYGYHHVHASDAELVIEGIAGKPHTWHTKVGSLPTSLASGSVY